MIRAFYYLEMCSGAAEWKVGGRNAPEFIQITGPNVAMAVAKNDVSWRLFITQLVDRIKNICTLSDPPLPPLCGLDWPRLDSTLLSGAPSSWRRTPEAMSLPARDMMLIAMNMYFTPMSIGPVLSRKWPHPIARDKKIILRDTRAGRNALAALRWQD